MTDPVTNSLVLQTQFGDDELKKEIDNHIIELAMAAAQQVVLNAFNNPEMFRRLVVNSNREFESAVARAMKNFFNNPHNIY